MAQALVNNFRYGEVSPKLRGRFDLEAYAQGCSSLLNMQVMRYGGVSRRPPLVSPLDAIGVVRINEFTLSPLLSFLIGFSTSGMVAYQLSIVQGKPSPIQYGTAFSYPYGYGAVSETDIREMCCVQYYRHLYITSSRHPLFRITLDSSDLLHADMPPVVVNGAVLSNGIPSYPITDGKLNCEEDGFKRVQLNQSAGNYASGCAVICDKLVLYATDTDASSIWASRPYNASQVLEDGDSSILDFIQYELVSSTSTVLKDTSEWPWKAQTSNGKIIYHISSETSLVALYAPRDVPVEDATKAEYYSVEGLAELFYEPSDAGYAIAGIDYNVNIFTDASHETPYTVIDSILPICVPYGEYDLANDAIGITREETVEDRVATASTAMQIQLSSGRDDRIQWVEATDRIYVGTQSAVWSLPMNITALDSSASRYADYRCQQIRPAILGRSIYFMQQGGICRALTTGQYGYPEDTEVTMTAEHILKAGVVDIVSKGEPSPCIYFVLRDGSMSVLCNDPYNGIQAWHRWTFSSFKVISLSCAENGSGRFLAALCESRESGGRWLAVFDESETEMFADMTEEGTDLYVSEARLNPLDSYSEQGATLGAGKSISKVVIRPYDSGQAQIGYSDTMIGGVLQDVETTPSAMGSLDYPKVIRGGSTGDLRLFIRSVGTQKLTMLAIGYEGRINK